MLLVDPAASERFKQFLLAKQNLTSRDVHLVLNYLCQTDFQSRELVDLLKGNEAMQRIMEIYSESVIATATPGYFDLGDAQVLKIAAYPNVIEQIRLRVQSERQHKYSIALNHLLNEIHTICYKLDKQRIEEKQYEAPKVSEFLISRKVPHETCLKIRNLFDRRNKNPVSHADPIAWPVGQDEYSDYHKHVGHLPEAYRLTAAHRGLATQHRAAPDASPAAAISQSVWEGCQTCLIYETREGSGITHTLLILRGAAVGWARSTERFCRRNG